MDHALGVTSKKDFLLSISFIVLGFKFRYRLLLYMVGAVDGRVLLLAYENPIVCAPYFFHPFSTEFLFTFIENQSTLCS